MASRNAKGRMIYWKISYSKQLSRCSILSKLIFTWLIPNTDDLGRMEGDPEVIKGMVFPYDEKITVKQIKEALIELTKERLIEWYSVDENYYIQFPKFSLYQKLRSDRVYKSDYPSPDQPIRNCDDTDKDCMTCPDMSCHVRQNLCEVKEKGSEGEEKESVPYQEIRESFNLICQSFSKIEKLSESRKSKIKTRMEEIKGIERLKEIFTAMEASDFLKGDNPRGWKATFDWLMDNDTNWVKVSEGQYVNKGAAKQARKIEL